MQDVHLAAVRGVLERSVGAAADCFDLALDASSDGLDWFEVSAAEGRVSVKANTTIALSRGAYHYLREACHQQVSWSGGPICLPERLPDYSPTRGESPVPMRHYLSVCTYGYSAVWWDWPRWEGELDWMALHGINFPLLLAGTEAVSRRVFRHVGISDQNIDGHFSGPAYLCWHRLGNLNGHMGPLPESWIVGQEKLQRLILERARALGMHPIFPGFSGFVPAAFGQIHPDVELKSAEAWAGFERTTYIDPRHPAFQEIGRMFAEEYRRTYGPAHHYLCEIFAEQVPCLEQETELDELRQIGQATWAALTSADPDANWVMQGWPFYFAREYWQPKKTAAMLDAVPPGRMFVLDLATEALETWRLQPAMREKGWMFNVVHNYGQNTHLHGDLQGFITRAQAALRDPDHGLLQGMGISPEGIDQNPVVYELLTDLMWSAEKTDLTTWIHDYARCRYGVAEAEGAWSILLKAIYGTEQSPHPRYCWRFRPGDQPLVPSPDLVLTGRAFEGMLGLAQTHGGSTNYRRDLVDVGKTWLGAIADRRLEQALESGAEAPRSAFFEILEDLDKLLSTRPEHRLSRWLNAARSHGTSARESDHFERNARSLITWWGGPFLFDYAIREWAGLISGFQVQRWRLWFDFLDGKSSEPDFARWELDWSKCVGPVTEPETLPEIQVAQEIFAKYGTHGFESESPLRLTRLEPLSLKNNQIHVSLRVAEKLHAIACIPLFGQGCRARYRAEASSDGSSWRELQPYGCAEATCRGVRFRFAPMKASFVRLTIDIVEGSGEQRFSLLIWSGETSGNACQI